MLEPEDEIETSPGARIKPPGVPEPPAGTLPEQMRQLLDTCVGKDFKARRDLAIIRARPKSRA